MFGRCTASFSAVDLIGCQVHSAPSRFFCLVSSPLDASDGLGVWLGYPFFGSCRLPQCIGFLLLCKVYLLTQKRKTSLPKKQASPKDKHAQKTSMHKRQARVIHKVPNIHNMITSFSWSYLNFAVPFLQPPEKWRESEFCPAIPTSRIS